MTKRVLFNAYDPANGVELWVTDGTAAGTYLLKNINPGTGYSNAEQFTSFRGKALFVANDGVHGTELWLTDGTSAGTTLLKDINSGTSDSSITRLTVLGDKALFRASDGVNGTELWVTDGTAVGTFMLRDIRAGSVGSEAEWFRVVGDKMLFQANDGVNGVELWVTDGSAAGTMLLKDLNPGTAGSYPSWFTAFGDKVLFAAYDAVGGNELWVTDGTAAGTMLLKDISAGHSDPSSFTVLGDKVLFSASDGVAGTELWVTDGTAAGTVMLKDLLPGSGSSGPFSLTRFGDKVLFNAGIANRFDEELWITDGTAAGTVLLKELNPGLTGSRAAGFKVLGDKIVFQAFTDASGYEGWVTDGTPEGTMMLKDIAPGSAHSYAGGGAVLGDIALFQANDGVRGSELWMTDGTSAGTSLLKEIVPGFGGSHPLWLTTVTFAELFLEGTSGEDSLVGSTGDDALYGQAGNDRLEGGDGADELEGGAGDDTVEGQGANDLLDGGDGSDILNGGNGNDRLKGGAGNDALDGGSGDDQLDPGRIEGEEAAHGGEGIDGLKAFFAATATAGLTSTLTANPLGGYDGSIGNGAGLSIAFSGIERFTVSGTAGDDRLGGGSLNDSLSGGAGNDVLTGGEGDDSLDGGTGADLMTGGAGGDSYRVDHEEDSVVEAAEAGIDQVATTLAVYALGANVEGLRGIATGQSLTGNGLDNRIEGGAGNDLIDGGAGADLMIGGAGNDVFVVDQSGDMVEDSAGTDEIRTGLAVYSLAGMASVENLTGILATGQQLTGNLLANKIVGGDGKDDLRGENGADQLLGGGDDDVLSGGEGADTLGGGAGNDVLDGGAGADSMTGGPGDDVYHIDQFSDVAVEEADGGIDELRILNAGFFTLGANVENATVVASSWSHVVGNAFANVLRGNEGWDRLDGGAGADTMIGGKGSDFYYVDNAGDVIVEEEDAFPPTSVGEGYGDTVSTSLADYSLRSDLENLQGTSLQQRLVGTDRGNFISSGGGQDTLIGGKGDDQYSVYAGDVVVESAGEGIDTVYANGGNFTLGDHVERLSGQSSSGQVLIGNGLANYIDASSGNDTLDGGAGADDMRGGRGNDVYFVDHSGDLVTELGGEGTDEVRTSLASYSLLGTNIEKLTATSDVGHDFRGNSGSNVVTGGGGNDTLRLQDGGADTVNAGGGNDNIFMIGSLTSADVVNGGAGNDTLIVQGNYAAGLTLTANVTQIELISILAGSNANFGEPGTGRYDYVITTHNANFAAGVQARINGSALLADEDFTFNGSAETDATFVVYGGRGRDTLTGGQGADIFFLAEERFATGDTVNGGAGYDGMFLRGNYTIDFNAPGYTGLFTNIENLTLTSATDERYARGGGTEFDYNLVLSDAIVKPGELLTISGALLMASETMIVDASAETDGFLSLFGGKADDTLKGGALADLIHGNLGADQLTGNGGADTFRFQSAAESDGANMDRILDFTSGTDRIELERIDADSLTLGNQAFSWIGSDAFSGSAGQLRAFEQGGSWFVEGDTNGDGSADLVIRLDVVGGPLGQSDFLL